MTQTERSISHKVLLVDDDDAVRNMMTVTLERKGFEVVAACQRDGSSSTYRNGDLRRSYHGSAHAERRRWFYCD